MTGRFPLPLRRYPRTTRAWRRKSLIFGLLPGGGSRGHAARIDSERKCRATDVIGPQRGSTCGSFGWRHVEFIGNNCSNRVRTAHPGSGFTFPGGRLRSRRSGNNQFLTFFQWKLRRPARWQSATSAGDDTVLAWQIEESVSSLFDCLLAAPAHPFFSARKEWRAISAKEALPAVPSGQGPGQTPDRARGDRRNSSGFRPAQGFQICYRWFSATRGKSMACPTG